VQTGWSGGPRYGRARAARWRRDVERRQPNAKIGAVNHGPLSPGPVLSPKTPESTGTWKGQSRAVIGRAIFVGFSIKRLKFPQTSFFLSELEVLVWRAHPTFILLTLPHLFPTNRLVSPIICFLNPTPDSPLTSMPKNLESPRARFGVLLPILHA